MTPDERIHALAALHGWPDEMLYLLAYNFVFLKQLESSFVEFLEEIAEEDNVLSAVGRRQRPSETNRRT